MPRFADVLSQVSKLGTAHRREAAVVCVQAHWRALVAKRKVQEEKARREEQKQSVAMIANLIPEHNEDLAEDFKDWEKDGALNLRGKQVEDAVRVWWNGMGFHVKRFVDTVEFRIVCREFCFSQLPPAIVEKMEDDHKFTYANESVSALKEVSLASIDKVATALWGQATKMKGHCQFHLEFFQFFEAFVLLLYRFSPWLGTGYRLTQGYVAKIVTEAYSRFKFTRACREQWMNSCILMSRYCNVLRTIKARFVSMALQHHAKEMRTPVLPGFPCTTRLGTGKIAQGLEAFQQEPDVEAVMTIKRMLFLPVLTLAVGKEYRQRGLLRVEAHAQGLLTPPEKDHITRLANSTQATYWANASRPRRAQTARATTGTRTAKSPRTPRSAPKPFDLSSVAKKAPPKTSPQIFGLSPRELHAIWQLEDGEGFAERLRSAIAEARKEMQGAFEGMADLPGSADPWEMMRSMEGYLRVQRAEVCSPPRPSPPPRHGRTSARKSSGPHPPSLVVPTQPAPSPGKPGTLRSPKAGPPAARGPARSPRALKAYGRLHGEAELKEMTVPGLPQAAAAGRAGPGAARAESGRPPQMPGSSGGPPTPGTAARAARPPPQGGAGDASSLPTSELRPKNLFGQERGEEAG